MFVLLLFIIQRVASNKDERNDIIAIPVKYLNDYIYVLIGKFL